MSDEEGGFVLELDGFSGPLDVLLDLARKQKVDLREISVVELADQYVAFVRAARALDLALAADYLVMAAWLVYLKARLLAPPDPDAAPPDDESAEMIEDLTDRLALLEAVRKAAEALAARPILGVDRMTAGAPEGLAIEPTGPYRSSLAALFAAWGRVARRNRPQRMVYHRAKAVSISEALGRLRAILRAPGWRELAALLPAELAEPEERRSALASSFVASLELARRGEVRLVQRDAFGPIRLAPVRAASGGEAERRAC